MVKAYELGYTWPFFGKYLTLAIPYSLSKRDSYLFKVYFTPVWFLFLLKETLSMVWFFLMVLEDEDDTLNNIKATL